MLYLQCNRLQKNFMKKVTHMSDEVFLFEEIEEIVAPTDGEFWGGSFTWNWGSSLNWSSLLLKR